MRPDFSIATTSYFSEKFIDSLIEKLDFECKKISQNYEIVVVDDHSKDGSWAKITELCKRYENLKAIRLSRNYGQQIASTVALDETKGEIVILMDGDFENPLHLFQDILSGIKEGNDIVYVTSKKRQTFFRKLTSSIFWEFCSRVLKLQIVKNQLMLRGMSRSYVDSFLCYRDYIRNVAIINFDMGGYFKIIETDIGQRTSGTKSNSNFFKRLDLFVDLIILISNKPLNWIFLLGIFSFISSCIFLAYSLIQYLTRNILPGYTSLIASIFLFGGLNLLVLSMIGRYLANVYTEVRKRPLYRIMDRI